MNTWLIDGKVTAQRCIDTLRWSLENNPNDGMLAKYIEGAIVWDNSPQGYHFWTGLCHRLSMSGAGRDIGLRLELALIIDELQQHADRMDK
jgi:hypothetical protein